MRPFDAYMVFFKKERVEILRQFSDNRCCDHCRWRIDDIAGGKVLVLVEGCTGPFQGHLGKLCWISVCQSFLLFIFLRANQGWGIFPHIVAPEDGTDLEDLVEQLGGAGVVILGLHKGGGMIFNKDGLVEPAKHMVQD